MEKQAPTLATDLIDDLCRHYREAERSQAILLETYDMRGPALDAPRGDASAVRLMED